MALMSVADLWFVEWLEGVYSRGGPKSSAEVSSLNLTSGGPARLKAGGTYFVSTIPLRSVREEIV